MIKSKELTSKQIRIADRWARSIFDTENIDVFSRSRKKEIVEFRSLHQYIIKKFFKCTYKALQKYYEDKGLKINLTTIQHHYWRVEDCENQKFLGNTYLKYKELSRSAHEDMSAREIIIQKIRYLDSKYLPLINKTLDRIEVKQTKSNYERVDK